jgi:hypothetical protein
MTISDYSVTAFALLNGARVIAYAPQIRCLTRDNSGAAAVSLITWTLFSMANTATVAYALLVIDDRLMAAVFALNLLGCLTIVVIIGKTNDTECTAEVWRAAQISRSVYLACWFSSFFKRQLPDSLKQPEPVNLRGSIKPAI